MKLIVETGATKSEWCLLTPDGDQKRIRTGGINFSSMSRQTIEQAISESFARLDVRPSNIKEVHIYAAGMLGGEMAEYFPSSYVECASDLLGAARALFGHRQGVAAILGTGSNSCLYDGDAIVSCFRSGGYIIGDEGGSTAIGRDFLADFIKGLVPKTLSEEFADEFKADYNSIVAGVYKSERPAAYIGSFTPWICRRYASEEYITELIDNQIRLFFKRALSRYGVRDAGIVGGFAQAMQQAIHKVAAEFGMQICQILDSPMDKLIQFHL